MWLLVCQLQRLHLRLDLHAVIEAELLAGHGRGLRGEWGLVGKEAKRIAQVAEGPPAAIDEDLEAPKLCPDKL